MKITFCGAARTVTGSQHLIEVNDQRILLDCGLFQGHRADTYTRNQTFLYDPATIDVLVLSHAHIDHSGNIPNLVRRGFKGDIVCTSATRDLAAAMLLDSAHIQESDAEYVNKQRAKKGEPPIEPLYTQEDARDCLNQFTTREYGRSSEIANGITCTFHDAGHMLGSAFVVLDIEDRDTGNDVRLVFSGDLGRKGLPILRDPATIDRADVLIMESTYGDRLHPPLEDDVKAMERIIAETFKRGGRIIIPAFAVGRTQQIVYSLHQLVLKGDLPNIPVYVDSPLAIDATEHLPPAPGVLRRGNAPVPGREQRARPIRLRAADLHALDGREQTTQLPHLASRHHQRQRHDGSRPRAASSQEQYRRPEHDYPDRRFPGRTHAGPPHCRP